MNWPEVSSFRGQVLGPVIVLEAVDSTSSEAFRRGERGEAPDGLVLVARHQTGGRGRRGHPWHSAPDQSVLLSLVYAPAEPLPDACTTLLGCVAVGDLLANLGIRDVAFKWPNDVLVEGRKVAGILAEARRQGPRTTGVVIGIGLNVGQGPGEFQDYRTPATSLRSLGAAITVPEAVQGLLVALDRTLVSAGRQGPGPLVERWLDGLRVRDRLAVLETTRGARVGTVRDFLPEGCFVLRDPATGARVEVPAGHVLALHHDD